MSEFSTFMSGMPLIGGLFENDDEEALKAQMANMAKAYQAYRPINAAVRGTQFNQQLNAWSPVNDYVSGMLPGIKPFDMLNARNAYGQAAAQTTGFDPMHPQQGATGVAGVTGGQGPMAFNTANDPRQTSLPPGFGPPIDEAYAREQARKHLPGGLGR